MCEMVMVVKRAHDYLWVGRHERSIICGKILVKRDFGDYMRPSIIALLTDFGIHDHYVGVMKGVILGIYPQAQIVDITHTIPPQNIRKAAYTLFNAYAYFPEGTIFVAVVDPGVGSSRRAIAVRHQGRVFIAPDNGLLTYVLSVPASERPAAVELANSNYRLSNLSATFHGRDIFSPAAAYIASGAALAEMGGEAENLTQLQLPECAISGDLITGNVWDIDTFGNIVTTIGRMRWMDDRLLTLQSAFGAASESRTLDSQSLAVAIGGQLISPLVKTYAAMRDGALGTLIGSEGFLEIAVRDGSAARRLDVKVGDPVQIQLKA